jgi:hypothetical protein
MAKSFSTYTLVRGKEPLLRRMLCEVRYQDGQLYLDHSGRLLKRLLKEAPEWVVAPNPTPQGTSAYNVRTGIQLAFAMNAASLSLDKTTADDVIGADELPGFLDQIDSTLSLVLDELEVTEFTRLGYREQYYFACDNKEESERWLLDLGLVTVAPTLGPAFSSSVDSLGVVIITQGTDCRYRIGLSTIERPAQIPFGETTLTVQASAVPQGQKKALVEALKVQRQRQINSAFAVVLDLDAYLLDPAEPDLRGFVEDRATTNLVQFREALPKETPKKGK